MWLSEAYLLEDRFENALRYGHEALALARRQQERGHEAWSVHLLAEIASRPHPRDVERAKSYYRDALTLAEELGMRPLVARCHLGLGRLYRRTGKRAQGQEHLATATTMYREMDMRFWLEQAEAEMREPA
jgi:tetratricopeptide (TPR) repeat protein